ncbi:hypothetical protein QR680_017148 [Steinernema hermaphroditum]|uniref:EGF-like domain-containing protein n=1 Tax=Steinernema hermaphroditum TaxID=289476 RepID=A0AA39LNT9_9BILA|nr:hypothetical protein QR680_017148 [Steinernema hermaphroditum]
MWRLFFPLLLLTTVSLAVEPEGFSRWFSAANFFSGGNPLRYFSRKFARVSLGGVCSEDADCSTLANAVCGDGLCRCASDFFAANRTCLPAPVFQERCANSTLCRAPFQCLDGLCECPLGSKERSGKCIKDCLAGSVLVEKENECFAVQELGAECSFGEQCSARYSECSADGRCRCIAGTVKKGHQCVTLSQCPLGETPLEDGAPLACDRASLKCTNGTYCLYAQFSDRHGFCCPEISESSPSRPNRPQEMNCPVGAPLHDKDCADCPWETHHCFTYTIANVQQQMCCPNDCPRSQPIRQENRCFAAAPHGSACTVDAQCASVAGALCSTESRTCECPPGHFHEGARCKHVAKLGDVCENSADCAHGSHTECVHGICQCVAGFIPEPMTFEDDQLVQEHCIARPFCPTISGLKTMTDDYIECDSRHSRCPEGKFCRRWWTDALRNKSYSLCCRTPSLQQYGAICDHFGMEMLLANSLEAGGALPIRCPLSPILRVQHDAVGDFGDESVHVCPSQSVCVFNPFSSNEGICCHYRYQR